MATVVTEYSKLLNNPKTRIVIAAPGFGRPIVSIIEAPLSIGGSNEFYNPFESQEQEDLSRKLSAAGTAVTGLANKLAGTKMEMSQFSLKNISQTIHSWSGSSRPTFQVRGTFVAMKESDDVTVPLAKLLRTVYPTEAKASLGKIGKASVLKAPLGYDPAKKAGLINLSYGEWFKATGLVMKSVSFEMSPETLKSGKPLSCTYTAELEPYRLLTYYDMLKFIGHSSSVKDKSFLGVDV